MKRPGKDNSDMSKPTVIIHHLLEAVEDETSDVLYHNDLRKYVGEDGKLLKEDVLAADLTDEQLLSLGAFTTVHQLHWAVHDLMEDMNVASIKNTDLRKIAKKHIPHVVAADDVPQRLKDIVNEYLGRK